VTQTGKPTEHVRVTRYSMMLDHERASEQPLTPDCRFQRTFSFRIQSSVRKRAKQSFPALSSFSPLRPMLRRERSVPVSPLLIVYLSRLG
jgi:hypothetical protein